MREFSPEYLRRTRRGMWEDSREALSGLSLSDRERVLDVGCGTGELSRVLASACSGEVVGCDVDDALLSIAREHVPVVRADATALPFATDAVDLVVCQALLINLPDPAAALAEFARVSSDLVAAIEPNNAEVTVDSSVADEVALARRARRAYLDGVDTDVTMGAAAREHFESAGIGVVDTGRYEHSRTIEPPYDEDALGTARRKATGAGLADTRETMLRGDLTDLGYEQLREDWREMGRTVVEQMRTGEYERTETVPFYVTVGRVHRDG